MIALQAVVDTGWSDHTSKIVHTSGIRAAIGPEYAEAPLWVRLTVRSANNLHWIVTNVTEEKILLQSAAPIISPHTLLSSPEFGRVIAFGVWSMDLKWIDKWGQLMVAPRTHMRNDSKMECHWPTQDVIQDLMCREFMFMDNFHRIEHMNYYRFEIPRS